MTSRERAEAWLRQQNANYGNTTMDDDFISLAAAIDAAVADERGACARLADKAEPLPNVDPVWLSGFRCAAESIGRMIRTRKGP